MRNWTFAIRTVLFLAVAGAVGLFIGWLVSRPNEDKLPPLPPEPAPVAVTQPAPVELAPPPAIAPKPAPRPVRATMPVAPPDDYDPTPKPWELSLEHILLNGDTDDNGKSDQILALMQTVPPDAEAELAQHLVNMTADDHYAGTAGLLTNSVTPVEVSTVLMNDLLNRNNSLKLPMLLDVAQQSGHPLADQAREMLELLLQEDHGTNWDDWNTAIATSLAQPQQ